MDGAGQAAEEPRKKHISRVTVVLVEVTSVVTGVVMGILAEPELFPWSWGLINKGKFGGKREKERGGGGDEEEG